MGHPRKSAHMTPSLSQWCGVVWGPTLCDTMDDSPPSSSVHGIFQASCPSTQGPAAKKGHGWNWPQSSGLPVRLISTALSPHYFRECPTAVDGDVQKVLLSTHKCNL